MWNIMHSNLLVRKYEEWISVRYQLIVWHKYNSHMQAMLS